MTNKVDDDLLIYIYAPRKSIYTTQNRILFTGKTFHANVKFGQMAVAKPLHYSNMGLWAFT